MSEPPAAASEAPRARVLLPLALLAALALASAIGRRSCWRDPTTPTDWQRAASHITSELSPKSRVLVHPHWSEAPLPSLSSHDHALLWTKRPLAEELDGVREIWVLTESTRLPEALARLPFQAQPDAITRHGTVTTARVPVPEGAAQVQWALSARAPEAKLLRPGSSDRPCGRWDARRGRLQCPERQVGAVSHHEVWVGGDLRRCLLLEVPERTGRMRVRFEDVALTEALGLRAGVPLVSARRRRSAPGPIQWALRVETERVAGARLEPGELGWPLEEIDTSAWAGRRADLTFELEATPAKEGKLCLEAWARPGSTPPPRDHTRTPPR